MFDHYLLQYFTWEHLPANLQSASKLFTELAHDVCAETFDPEYCCDAVKMLIPRLRHELPDNEESAWSQLKLREAEAMLRDFPENRGATLRLVLEAKDCAVRSMVFKKQ